MTNPVVHALAFILAIIVPGGLGVYFAWRFMRNKKSRIQDIENPEEHKEQDVMELSPEEVKQAFLRRYPKESLRAKSRIERLRKARALKTRPRKKSQ